MQVISESESLTAAQLRPRDVHTFYLCALLTELLIYFMVVFSPWAFGTTEPWSIWTMNGCGYALGVLLFSKLILRKKKMSSVQYRAREDRRATVMFIRVPGIATLLILAYCLMSALNRRAKFNPESLTFDYFDCLQWLPHSLESSSSWRAFWTYLALACSFWAVGDWSMVKTTAELRAGCAVDRSLRRCQTGMQFPIRVQRLLFVLAISGGLLGLEGIVQRFSNSPRLLFLVVPEIHQNAVEQFASYAYRANAAQYFNLLWPVCLGFWWTKHGCGPSAAKAMLMCCVVIMAACPLISGSRGAALVDVGMLAIAVLVLLSGSFNSDRNARTKLRSSLNPVVFAALVLALGFGIGWKSIRTRAGELGRDLVERNELYERGHLIARDYPLFGTGPGTFEHIYQLYRRTPDAYWPAQLHNDWLETRITFGWFGSGLIALAFLALLVRWFGSGRIQFGTPFVVFTWLSLTGCLVQARWDFPLQVYSILFLFLVWCALLSTMSRKA